jgi:hypothetical protein
LRDLSKNLAPKLGASGATIGRCFKHDLATEAKLGKTVAAKPKVTIRCAAGAAEVNPASPGFEGARLQACRSDTLIIS